jgi:hypothetical protein
MGNTNATPTTSNLPKLFLSIGEHLSSYSRATSTSQKKSILFQLIHDLDRAKILLRMVAPTSSTLNGTSTTETTMASTPLATSVDTCFDIATEILIMSVGSDNDSKVAGSLLKIFDVDRKVNGPSSSSSTTKPKKKKTTKQSKKAKAKKRSSSDTSASEGTATNDAEANNNDEVPGEGGDGPDQEGSDVADPDEAVDKQVPPQIIEHLFACLRIPSSDIQLRALSLLHYLFSFHGVFYRHQLFETIVDDVAQLR